MKPHPECMACKWSGVDEQEYRAYGCPDCKCEELRGTLTAKSISEAWKNFKPKVPLAFVLAARKARRWWR